MRLGDLCYVGKKQEYLEHVLAGKGYFDTLLQDGRFARWHGDEAGEPSSFFVIKDAHWQFFGLDSSWNTPSLGDAAFGDPTFKDYGGQNGILTNDQVEWMARRRNPSKGCVLLTHHQPASSRKGEVKRKKASMNRSGVCQNIRREG